MSIVNISLDSRLWEMGAYILVECKNWQEKVGIQVIRGLAHISELKGNKTIFLFAANGITSDAEKRDHAIVCKWKICVGFYKE